MKASNGLGNGGGFLRTAVMARRTALDTAAVAVDNCDMQMDSLVAATDDGRFGSSVRAATLKLGGAYWLAVFVSSSILWGIAGTDPLESAIGKAVALSLAGLIAAGITALLFRLRTWPLIWKALVCFGLSLLAAPVFCLIEFAIYTICMYPIPVSFDWANAGYNLIYGMSLFFGWSCLFLALLYNAEVRDSEKRLAAAREEALSAQMRALHYQVNPHFLFNTLNSMAGLIEEGAFDRARDMILDLSSFLRTTLTLDPMQDVRLVDEIALQASYLDIERNRFSDRMTVKVEIGSTVRDALVPSLILQPLIENAVKHGVGRTPGMVEISIRAVVEEGKLSLVVENDTIAEDAADCQEPAGIGIGLWNVAQRIGARFADDGSCVSQRIAPNRFQAVVTMPLVFA